MNARTAPVGQVRHLDERGGTVGGRQFARLGVDLQNAAVRRGQQTPLAEIGFRQTQSRLGGGHAPLGRRDVFLPRRRFDQLALGGGFGQFGLGPQRLEVVVIQLFG